MKELILKALGELDPLNDEHWNRSGLARVDVVAALAGLPELKRRDIDEASPGFTRESARDVPAGQDGSTGAQEEPAIKDEVSEWIGERASLQEQLLESQRQRDALQQNERELSRQIDALTVKIEAAVPPLREQEIIQDYINSEQRLRRERIEAEPESARAPIDRALAASRGRGTGRPQFPIR